MDKPFSDLDSYIIVVGRITVALTGIEIYLDFITAFCWQKLGGHPSEREIPMAFDKKVKFCRKCFNQKPELAELKDDAISLLTRASDLATRRNHTVHGMVDNFTPVPDGTIIMRKIEYEKDRHNVVTWPTSLKEINNLANAALVLQRGFALMTNDLCEQFGIEAKLVSKPLGEVVGASACQAQRVL